MKQFAPLFSVLLDGKKKTRSSSKSKGAPAFDVHDKVSKWMVKLEITIISLATKILHQRGGVQASDESSDESETDEIHPMLNRMGDFADDPESQNNFDVIQLAVQDEIERYKKMKVTKSLQKDILKFWNDHRVDFPSLFVIAAAVFGAPSSAGGIEVDFGEAGRMLTPSRTSLAFQYIEVVQVLRRNRALLNIAQVNSISDGDVINVLPRSPLEMDLDSEDEEEEEADLCHELSEMLNLNELQDEFD